MHRRLSTALALGLAAALLAPAASADPIRLTLFSAVDHEAVEVGGLVQVNVEALASPESAEAGRALADAFGAWDLTGQVGPELEVVRFTPMQRRDTDGVIELQRRLVLRVRQRTGGVPALRLVVEVDGRDWTFATRPHTLETFGRADRAREAGASVVAITAEGEVEGAGFQRVGSAFLVGDDALVTAFHVVVGARRVRVALPDGDVWVDRVWSLDPARDVAVLHLPREHATGLRPLVVAPEDAGGAVAFTSGWPDRERRETVAVRFDDLQLDGQRLRVSANAVRPGDSGGPLLDEAGRVLGVVVSGRGVTAEAGLLSASICIASDPASALRRYRSATASIPIRRALEAAVDMLPSARAHQAAGALAVPSRDGRDQPHLALLRSALHDAPEDPALLYLAGTVLEEAGEGRLAAGAFQAAHRAGYVPAGYSLAHHLLRAGRHRAAAELFAEAARGGAYRRLGAYGQAQALVALGRYDEAEAPLAAVLDHDPRFGPALYLLGLVRMAQRRVPEAQALAVRLSGQPEWAGALDLPLRTEALRPPSLEPLPRVALR